MSTRLPSFGLGSWRLKFRLIDIPAPVFSLTRSPENFAKGRWSLRLFMPSAYRKMDRGPCS